MEVKVDFGACESNGICAGLVPEVFDLDDNDFLHILEPKPPERLADQVRHAVRSCPKAAISVDE